MSRQLLRLLQSTPLKMLGQGATLSIQSEIPVCLRIVPTWREDGHLSLQQTLHASTPEAEAVVNQEQDSTTSMGRLESHISVSIVAKMAQSPTNTSKVSYDDGLAQESPLTLTAEVPEKVNISCDLLDGGSISVEGKVEGDIKLVTSDGNINVKKLRGHNVEIAARSPGNIIYASDVLEAQNIDISTLGRVRAKRMHATNVDVRAEGRLMDQSDIIEINDTNDNDSLADRMDVDDEGAVIDISSLFVSRNGYANLVVDSPDSAVIHRSARVKSNHGHLSVEAVVPNVKSLMKNSDERQDSAPLVELGGVNGSCDVSIHLGGDSDIKGRLAGQIHFDSLSPDSVSAITSNQGDLSITLDRKLEADIRLVSSPNITSLDTRQDLVDDENPETIVKALNELKGSLLNAESKVPNIQIESEAFTKRPTLFSDTNVEYVDGWVENKSQEPDSRFEAKTLGRVGAGKIRVESAATQALSGFAGSTDEHSDSDRPLLLAATSDRIILENLSWLGAIARRYGLDEDGHKLGRQATRSGRPIKPTE